MSRLRVDTVINKGRAPLARGVAALDTADPTADLIQLLLLLLLWPLLLTHGVLPFRHILLSTGAAALQDARGEPRTQDLRAARRLLSRRTRLFAHYLPGGRTRRGRLLIAPSNPQKELRIFLY